MKQKVYWHLGVLSQGKEARLPTLFPSTFPSTLDNLGTHQEGIQMGF